MGFIVQNWQQVWDDTFYLYERIRKAGFVPDVIIGIARGGWIPARLIADFFNIKHTANVKAEAYQLIGQEEVEAKITQTLSTNIQGKNVLVVDDVADSGATLEAVLKLIKQEDPTNLRTAMLYYKPRSSIVPDFYVHETSDWVIFSWSIYESVGGLEAKWSSEGLSKEEIKEKCKSIGISPAVVNSYFELT